LTRGGRERQMHVASAARRALVQSGSSAASNSTALRRLHQGDSAVPAWGCSSFIQSIFKDKDGRLGKWLTGGVMGGASCLDGGCDMPVQMGPVPTTVSVQVGACLPWLEYANVNGYDQVCAAIEEPASRNSAACAVNSAKAFH
jgi:hypothetical protein